MVGSVATNFAWELENQQQFQAKINELGRVIGDFRIPFTLIASDFYKSNRRIFTLQGSGLYQDLAPARGEDGNPTTTSNYKKRKQKVVGFAYPILVGKTRELSNSILGKNNKYSHFILTRQSLEMGTTDPKAKFHQSDMPRTKIPLRKFIFIDGGPADKSNDGSINGRRERWTNIIDDHIEQIIKGRVL